MKLMRENKFSTLVTRIKKRFSGSKLNTLWGKIEDFFFIDYYDEEIEDEILDDEEIFDFDDDFDVEDANGGIYYFEAHSVVEYTFVKTLLADGYTVIVSLGLLDEEERNLFTRRLRLDLFKLGISCTTINENCLLVAPKSVEIVNFEEEQEPKKGRILYLDNYRKMK